MKNVSVIGKVLVVLTAFAAFVLLSVMFTTGKMRHIDDSYSAVIAQQGKSGIYLAYASRAISQSKGAIADLTISISDADNTTNMALLAKSKKLFKDSMDKAAAADVTAADIFGTLKSRGIAIVDDNCMKTIKLGEDATVAPTVAQAEYTSHCGPVFDAFVGELNTQIDKIVNTQDMISNELTGVTDNTILMTYVSVLGGVALVLFGAYFAVRAWISRPLRALASTMAMLAAGDQSVTVDGIERKDEIGPMAQAVQVFKENGLRLKSSETEALRQRQAADQQRAANEATQAEAQRQQQAVMTTIASGLDRMSKGDLTSRLSQTFTAEYEKLRADFNATADSLREAMSTIMAATDGISTGSDQIAHASDDLSRRTEQQAASLEETSAALSQITDTVKVMATNASQAATVVQTARGAAENSGAIVTQAIDAMSQIKASSNQIGQIIGVIDEIAFQTNLLALNAGVEAARAGDAGRGFAVVASEVRALAQRSAEAAKEIKTLISASSIQVESGVVLVDKTGVALKEIIAKVSEMDLLVRQISASSQEQATGLAEINIAVRQMDQVVQQNAAMVEESTAAAHALKSETQDLNTMVGRFQIGDQRTVSRSAPAPTAIKVKPVSRPAAPRAVARSTGNAAHKIEAAGDSWEEF